MGIMHSAMLFDLKFAFKRAKNAPIFCAGVILLLGIALGGTVGIATTAYQLFIKPLPYTQPERLVQLDSIAHAMSGYHLGLSPAMYNELRNDSDFDGLAAFEGVENIVDNNGQTWRHAQVTSNITALLGIPPLLGRAFTVDDNHSKATTALISERVWKNRFSGDPEVLGKLIELKDQRLIIIGVIPNQFSIPEPGTELWTPLVFESQQLAANAIDKFTNLDVIGRLPKNVNAETAQEKLRSLYSNDLRVQRFISLADLELIVEPLQKAWTRQYQKPLKILSIAIVLLLLATAFNLAGLWMERMISYRHQLSIQAALGGGHYSSLKVFLIEYLVLGIFGIICALIFASIVIHFLKVLNILKSELPIYIQINSMSVVFATCFLLLSAFPIVIILFWQARNLQHNTVSLLMTGSILGNISNLRIRNIFIAIQLSIALSLLINIGMLLQSWQALLHEDVGFETENLLLAQINYNSELQEENQQSIKNNINNDPVREYLRSAIAELTNQPGIDAAAFTTISPFSSIETVFYYTLPDQPIDQFPARITNVSLNYFQTMGIPIKHGFAFADKDINNAASVAIVDQRFIDLHFPNGNGLGERVLIGGKNSVEIVGVVNTVKHSRPDENKGYPNIYFPAELPDRFTNILLRTSLPPDTMASLVNKILEDSLGGRHINRVVSMDSMIRRTVSDREPQLVLLSVFAGLTLLLAAVGVYALLSYSVRQRSVEFGVRLAVGAKAKDIRWLVLNNSFRLLFFSVLAGTFFALISSSFISGYLYKVAILDPLSWIIATVFVVIVVLIAVLLPSEQAARTAPIEVLRYE